MESKLCLTCHWKYDPDPARRCAGICPALERELAKETRETLTVKDDKGSIQRMVLEAELPIVLDGEPQSIDTLSGILRGKTKPDLKTVRLLNRLAENFNFRAERMLFELGLSREEAGIK